MNKTKLYCFFTPSHKHLYEKWLKPSAMGEYDLCPIEFDRQISKSGSYKELGWRETQYNKVLAWIEAIKDNMGDIIICADADIQFLRPSSRYLKDALADNHISFQQNGKGQKICSGFFVCRCSIESKNFMEVVARRLKKIMHKKGGGEQYIMWDLIEEGWIKTKIGKLSYDKIWNPGVRYEDINELKIPNQIMVHHANWTKGEEQKLEQLKYVKNSCFPYEAFLSIGSFHKSSKKSKIAICASSQLRNLSISTESIINKIIHTLPYRPDFIGYFTDKCETEENLNYLHEIKKECNGFNCLFQQDEPIKETLLSYNHNINTHQRHGLEGNLLQWQSMKNCLLMKQEIESKAGEKYDWVIWMRPDLHFFNSLENLNNLDASTLYIPAHDNHLGGIMDRFSLGNSELMDIRMDIFNYFEKEWYMKYHNDSLKLFKKPDGDLVWNPEIVLRDLIYEKIINHKKINLCSGKIRENKFVTIPFWHEVSGNSFTSKKCENDIVNPEVLRSISKSQLIKNKVNNNWFEVQV